MSPHPLPVRTRPPGAVSAAAFVSSFDRFAVGPLLVVVAVDMGASLAQTMAIASGYFLAYGLSQPLWGALSDRLGRVRLMRATLMGAAVTGVVSALAPDLGVLVAARALTGACFGAIIPTSLTYVGDTVDEARRQPALADLMAAVAVGTALATAAAGLLAHLADWRVVFAVPSVLAVGCAVALRRLHEPRRAARPGLATTVRDTLRNRWVLGGGGAGPRRWRGRAGRPHPARAGAAVAWGRRGGRGAGDRRLRRLGDPRHPGRQGPGPAPPGAGPHGHRRDVGRARLHDPRAASPSRRSSPPHSCSG